METGLVTLLATLGVVRGPLGALSAGLAAALRPELLPYAAVLGAGGAFLGSDEGASRARLVSASLALALGPALVVALVRNAWFGSPAPLSLAAKPPDLWPGLRYALAATLFAGPFVVVMAPLALRRSRPVVYRLAAALLAHFVAMALAGGDWMQLYRLAVPVLPAALLAGAELASDSSRSFHLVRAALALAVSLLVAITGAWPARSVLETRLEFIEKLRRTLASARVTATEDAGLVGAATPRAVFDLAGVTDPVVAHLSGGHASKRVSDGLVESRGADHAVLLLAPGTSLADPWQASQFARPVEARLASLPSLERFELVAVLGLGQTPYRYVIVALRPAGQSR